MDMYNGSRNPDYRRSNTRMNSNCRSANNFSQPYTRDNVSFPWREQFPIGMAYVPMQQFKDLYEMEKGLHRGTIFAQLDLPFAVGFCARGGGCQ